MSSRLTSMNHIFEVTRAAPAIVALLLSGISAAAPNDEQPPASDEPGSVDVSTSNTADVPAAGSRSAALPGEIGFRADDGTWTPFSESGLSDEQLRSLVFGAGDNPAVPDVTLAELRMSGRVSGTSFLMTVEMAVHVLPNDRWVEFDIPFDSLQLAALPQHRSAAPGARHSFLTEDGRRRWLLSGAGDHQLTLELVGHVRTGPGGKPRIRMAVPSAPVSRLTIQFDSLVESVFCNSDLPPQTETDAETQQSQLSVVGVPRDLEISWQKTVPGTGTETVIQSQGPARITADLTTQPASLIVEQPLRVLVGSVRNLSVTLPRGFRRGTIQATNDSGLPLMRPLDLVTAAAGGRVELEFSESVTGLLRLQYDLSLTDQRFPQTVSIATPDIAEVDDESADVNLLVPPGLTVEQVTSPADAESPRRRRVDLQEESRNSVTSYRLPSARSQLNIQVAEIQAFFNAEPIVELEVRQDNLLMTAEFPVNVIVGSLNDVVITWPSLAQSDWEILPGSLKLISGDAEVPLTRSRVENREDALRLVFPQRQSGQFTVRLEAFRGISDVRESGTQFVLPDLKTSAGHAATVRLIDSDTLSVRISASDGSSFPEVPRNPSSPTAAVADSASALSSLWLVSDPSESVRLSFRTQQPEVRASLTAEFSEAVGAVRVHEELRYQVRYRDISDLELRVPAGVIPVVRLEGTDAELPVRSRSADSVFYQLPVPARGLVQVSVDFLWSVSGDNAGDVEIPLAMPADVQPERLVVATNSPEIMVLRQPDDEPDWTPVYSPDYRAAWQRTSAPTGPATVPMQLRGLGSSAEGPAPELILAEAVFGAAHVTTQVSVIYSRRPTIAMFRIPREVRLADASVNDRPAVPVLLSPESGERTDAAGEVPADSADQIWMIRVPAVQPAEPAFSAGRDDVNSDAETASPIGRSDDSTPGSTSENPQESAPDETVVIRLLLAANGGTAGTLFRTAKPPAAVPVGVSADINTIWLLSTQAGESVVPMRRPGLALSSSHTSPFWRRPAAEEIRSSAGNCLSALPQAVRRRAESVIDAAAAPRVSLALLNSASDGLPAFAVIPMKSLLLCAALLCLMCYSGLSLFHRSAGTLRVTIGALVIGGLFALLTPEPLVRTASWMMPGCVAALCIWLWQRFLDGTESSAASVTASASEETVLAAEAVAGRRGSSVHASTVIAGSHPSALPSAS